MALTKIKTGGITDNAVTDAKVADAITVTGAQTGITQVGTLTAGTWQGTAIASAYLDADTAHLSGSTFTGDVYISASGSPSFRVTDTTNTVTGKFQADDSVGKVGTHTNHSFQLFSNNTTALTLDTSQNATFAGHATFTSGKYLNMNSANTNWLIGRNIGTPSGGFSLDHAMQIKVYSDTAEGFEIYNHSDENLLSIQGSSGSTWIRGYCEVGSQVYTGDGSVSAPALTFTGDSNTGIYRSASDTLAFSTGGTQRMRIMSGGEVLKPTLPAFLSLQSANQNNLSASTNYDVDFGTEIFDQGGNFNDVDTFTAPATGRYQLNFQMQLENMDIDATYYKVEIVTSNRDYSFYRSVRDTDVELYTFSGAVLADMDTNDTAKLVIYQVGGAAQTDIKGGTWFSGFLAC